MTVGLVVEVMVGLQCIQSPRAATLAPQAQSASRPQRRGALHGGWGWGVAVMCVCVCVCECGCEF